MTSKKEITVSEFIDAQPISQLQWRVVGLCFLVAFVDGYDLYSMALAAPIVGNAFDISPESMGTILSSSLLGLMIGAMFGGPLADRVGRKPVIIVSCLIMGVMTLLTATANSEATFLAYRFLTGLGLGAAMPTINALTSEYAPVQRRAFLMTAMFIGVPFGNVAGSFFAGYASNALGWQSIFIAGGVFPIILAGVLFFVLPESLHFLARDPSSKHKVRAIVKKMSPGFAGELAPEGAREGQSYEPGGVRDLFTEGRAKGTFLIWGIFLISLFMTFALASWLPSVLRLSGFPIDRALYMSAGAGVGVMIGSLLIAYLIDRYGYFNTIMAAAFAGSASLVLLGVSTFSLPLTILSILLAGASVGGLQIGLNALAAHYYPIHIRSTGLGWALAIGRIGAIIGPILMGILIARNWSLPAAFAVVAAPGVVTVYLLFLLRRLSEASTEPAPQNQHDRAPETQPAHGE